MRFMPLLTVLWVLYYLTVVPFTGLMVDIFSVVILVSCFPVMFPSSHLRQCWVCGLPLAILPSVALTTGYSWLEWRAHVSIRVPFPDCGHSWLIKRWAFDPGLANSFPRNFRLGLRERSWHRCVVAVCRCLLVPCATLRNGSESCRCTVGSRTGRSFQSRIPIHSQGQGDIPVLGFHENINYP